MLCCVGVEAGPSPWATHRGMVLAYLCGQPEHSIPISPMGKLSHGASLSPGAPSQDQGRPGVSDLLSSTAGVEVRQPRAGEARESPLASAPRFPRLYNGCKSDTCP